MVDLDNPPVITSLTLPADLHERIARLARREGRHKSQVIRELLELGLAHYRRKGAKQP